MPDDARTLCIACDACCAMMIEEITMSAKLILWILMIILIAFPTMAIENVLGPIDIDTLVQDLSNENITIKVNAVKILAGMGETAVSPLINATKDKNPDIRENSAYALGKIGSTRAIEPLIELLGDEHSEVQAAASLSLAKIGVPALGPVSRILNDSNENYNSKINAIRILGEMGELAIEPLIKVLGTADGPDAADSLGNIGEPAVKPLISLLADKDPQVRADAAMALGNTKSKEAVDPLIKMLEDKDPSVRSRSAMALGKIGDEKALDPLTLVLKDKDFPVEQNARLAIENINSKDENYIIATYGKEREFYIEDERKEWLAKLDIIGRSARSDIEKLVQPNGPVITYGLNYQGYIVVEFLKDSEIDPYQLEIYNIIDAEAKINGITDIPVLFKYGGVIPTQDVTGEGYEDETVSIPGFTVHLFLPAIYACFWLTKRTKYTKESRS